MPNTSKNTIHCQDCDRVFTLAELPNASIPLCQKCYPKYDIDFKKIRHYLRKNAESSKAEIHRELGISMRTIELCIGAGGGAPISQVPTSANSYLTNTTLSKSFQDANKVIKLNISHDDILSQPFHAFIMIGDEFSISNSQPIELSDLKAGAKPRQLYCTVHPESSPYLQKLLTTDGIKIIIYLENKDFIIPAELLYFTDRQTTLTLMPNKIRLKSTRSQRLKLQKTAMYRSYSGTQTEITTNDISKTGISFFCDKIIASKNEVGYIGDRKIVIVDREKINPVKYLYRAYFDN